MSVISRLEVEELADLVQDDRIHRTVYTDPAIFELEMEKIFGSAWIFVGHESQVPSPGDFLTTTIGTRPVLLSRHSDNKVYVLYNRCGHRGALVCNEHFGNTGKSFRCAYHGWTFKTDGKLLTVPLKSGYPECYDLRGSEFAMNSIQTENYRGFIFACVSTHPLVSFEDYIRPMKPTIDDIVDRAPEGRIRVSRKAHRYIYYGNWKEQTDNGGDVYHPPYGHESTMSKGERQFQRREGQEGVSLAESTAGPSPWDQIRMHVFPNGNNYIGPLPGAEKERSGPVWEKYTASLIATYGEARAKEIVKEKFHAGFFWPNLILHMLSQHVRVIHPIGVDKTEVRVYPIELAGAPEEMNRAIIRYMNVTHSPASLIQTDDLECFRRVQLGLQRTSPEWVVLGRGYRKGEDTEAAIEDFGTSESAIRSHYRAWKKYMTA